PRRRRMAGRHEAIDQRFVLGGEAVIERTDVIVPMRFGARTRDHRADERRVQHPPKYESSRGNALALGVALYLLRELERFRPPFGLHHTRVVASGARVLVRGG